MNVIILNIILCSVIAYYLQIYNSHQTLQKHSPKKLDPFLITIPFTLQHNDVSALHLQLESIWQKFPPCDDGYDTFVLATVALYTNKEVTLPLKTKLRRLIANIVHEQNQSCINPRALFINAAISKQDDYYPLGASLMFFKWFSAEFAPLRKQFRYMLYMETDLIPCQAHWLSKLARQSFRLEELGLAFWIRGSLLRYHPFVIEQCINKTLANQKISQTILEYGGGAECNCLNNGTIVEHAGAPFKYHINGNAVYAIGDSDFVDFMGSIVVPYFSENAETVLRSYDIAIYGALNNRSLVPWPLFTEIAHRFQYTPSIVNFYYRTLPAINITSYCAASAETLLVHSKNVLV